VVRGQVFKGRQFAAEVIPWAVHWYLMFPISKTACPLCRLRSLVPAVPNRREGLGRSSRHRGRGMRRDSEAFIGIDTAKARNAVAIAEGGRHGELRYLGEFDNTPEAVNKPVRRLAERHGRRWCTDTPDIEQIQRLTVNSDF
jgi:hypothetical protein